MVIKREKKPSMLGKDLTARLMTDMDPELLAFLETYVDSFIKWELLRFFCENPHTMDTAENIARYAGWSAQDIEPELEGLTHYGIIQEKTVGEIKIYVLNPDEKLREKLEKFTQASNDREFRRKAIYHLVRH